MTAAGAWVCPACGTSYPPSATPPSSCAICEDERQWVPPAGQRWATTVELAQSGHRSELREVEPGLLGIGVEPELGVGHRALLVQTPAGNVLWDPPAFVDEQAIEAVRELGGVRAVSSSHPHMYGAIVEWSHAFDAAILLPEADVPWLMRPDPAVRAYSGALAVVPGVTLVQCGGHFPGSAVLHWSAGAAGAGVLCSGDTIFVTPGEDRVTFLWSAPNRLPLPEREVRGVADAVAPYPFDRIYGGWWEPVVRGDAKRVFERSAERYVEILRGELTARG
jgi:glyoxylase-like metal-dependent hydrolase (beta-lactamase superfamily II)